MTEATINQFNELRLLLETNVSKPGIVVVTSARKEDGTRFAAYGLADSLAACGHRTLFLRVAEDSGETPVSAFRSMSEQRVPRTIGDRGLLTADAAEYRITPSMSRDGVGQALAALRTEFSYVVVDAGIFPKRPLTALLTTVCDATLVALRSGRNKSSADTVIANAIATTQMSVLGIVSTSRKAIEAFESLDLAEHVQKPRFLKVESVAAGV